MRHAWSILTGLHEALANILILGYVYFGNYESDPTEKCTCLFSVYQMLF